MSDSIKKVGILTYHRGPNYGGFLQAWHLKEAIRRLEWPVGIINYQNPEQAAAEKPRLLGIGPRHLKGFLFNWIKSRPFQIPVSKLSNEIFRTKVADVDWHTYQRVVVGSDVIWDFTKQDAGKDRAFFGQHECQQATSFIAYAASCGATPHDVETVPGFIEEGLKRFSAIAVRDSNTASFVQRMIGGDLPPIVLDPTWLNDDPEPIRPKKIKVDYLVIYGLSSQDYRARVARQFCDRRGLHLVSAGTPCRYAHQSLRSLDPFQWAKVIAGSSGVITSTLHGSHYAIKYQRPMAFVESPSSYLKARDAIQRSGRSSCAISEEEEFTESFLQRCLLDDPIRSGIPREWLEFSWSWLEKNLRMARGI